MGNRFLKDLWKFLTNRLLVFSAITIVLFYCLVVRLFDLQIIHGNEYEQKLSATQRRTLPISAPRGTLYDNFGRPLAINKSAFTVKINPSVPVENMTEVAMNIIDLFEKNHEEYVDDFPISLREPYVFDSFQGSEKREQRWKEDMEVPIHLNAEGTMAFLREKFKIPKEMPNEKARKVLSIRSAVFMQRFRKYEPITIAFGVKDQTVVALEEENNEKYQSVFIDVEALRNYPAGEFASHIVGYIGKISDKEYEERQELGYTNTDLVGKSGMESAFEDAFRGETGEMVVEVNKNGQVLEVLNEEKAPVPGDKIILTIDQNLQEKLYLILEKQLIEVLESQLLGRSKRQEPITQKQLFRSMVQSNNISTTKIMESNTLSDTYPIKEYVQNAVPEAVEKDDLDEMKQAVLDGIEDGSVSSAQMILALYEQKLITLTEEELNRMRSSRSSGIMQLIIKKMHEGEITPQMTNLDPSTGTIVVVNVKDGSVKAAVNYPSYDNNQFVNNFNNEYWYKMNDSDDATTPMVNRAFMEPRAPGSTFKVISAIAGLEEGAIDLNTKIYDYLSFTEAGNPPAKCWSSVSHGNLNVIHALEVSCNYFFCEVAYRMGNAKNGKTLEGIQKLNEYMKAFGLNERTGVEIGEFNDVLRDAIINSYQSSENGKGIVPENILTISAPFYKEYIETSRNAAVEKTVTNWYDGDTVRTAFGQAYNNYTAASMAKYFAMLANGGVRYPLHFLNRRLNQKTGVMEDYIPGPEYVLEIAPENLQAVYDGMLLVTEGRNGTAVSAFQNFPVRVAGKTGTAQEVRNRKDHSSFGGFAPYEDPQIAVYVLIPFGDTVIPSAPAARVAREVIQECLGMNNEAQLPLPVNALSM